MPLTVSKASLSPAWKHLVKLMQEINFGYIEEISIHDGKPVFDPPPRVIREVKFGGANGPHAMTSVEDFALKSQVRELFERILALGNGIILALEVKNGLPFKMTILEEIA